MVGCWIKRVQCASRNHEILSARHSVHKHKVSEAATTLEALCKTFPLPTLQTAVSRGIFTFVEFTGPLRRLISRPQSL